MPQLNGGGGDDLGANDELISFKDEGEQEEKSSENSSAERDLADVKSSLVNESETNQNSSSDSEVGKAPRAGGVFNLFPGLGKCCFEGRNRGRGRRRGAAGPGGRRVRAAPPLRKLVTLFFSPPVTPHPAGAFSPPFSPLFVAFAPRPPHLHPSGKAERRPPPRSESFRDKSRESLEEGEYAPRAPRPPGAAPRARSPRARAPRAPLGPASRRSGRGARPLWATV